MKIVGEDLHPIGQVKDFAPYVAKIKQSGADTIVTGNWGADLTLLVKALNDAGLKIPMYTYYAGVTGTPTALAAGGDGEVYVVAYGHCQPHAARWASWRPSSRRSSTTTTTPSPPTTASSCCAPPWPRPSPPTR